MTALKVGSFLFIMRSFVQKDGKFIAKIFKSKKIILLIISTAFVLIIFSLFKDKAGEKQFANYTDQRIQPSVSKASQKINKTFTFSIGNTKFTYAIDSAQLQDEIVLKGQRATAVKGKTFLIINLKIRNDNKLAAEINTRDYIRLSVNGNKSDRLAADIHNDPVLVQAISAKQTRLGFPIKDNDKNLILYVGEIEGGKQEIVINF